MRTPSATNTTTISFDADGTLWDFLKAMREGLHLSIAAIRSEMLSKQADELTVDRLIAIRDQIADEVASQGLSHEQVRQLAFERTLEQIDQPDVEFAKRLTESYLEHRFRQIDTFPDVIPALDVLRQHFVLGLVSNGNSYPDACGLAGYFDFEIFSFRCGIAKPDPAIFGIALTKAGCSNDHMLHVGDSLENDVMCPQQAGIAAVWLNRTGRPASNTIIPEYQISTLHELTEILLG